MNDDMQFEIAKLTLKPGDVLVIRTPVTPTKIQATHIKDWLRELLSRAGHPNTEVLVIGNAVELEILEHAA